MDTQTPPATNAVKPNRSRDPYAVTRSAMVPTLAGDVEEIHRLLDDKANLDALVKTQIRMGIYWRGLDQLIGAAYAVKPADELQAAIQQDIAGIYYREGGRLRTERDVIAAYRNHGAKVCSLRDLDHGEVNFRCAAFAVTLNAFPQLAANYEKASTLCILPWDKVIDTLSNYGASSEALDFPKLIQTTESAHTISLWLQNPSASVRTAIYRGLENIAPR